MLKPNSLVGKTIGSYEVLAELGRGGMGIVYKAHEQSLQRVVALKVLPAHLAQDPVFVKRFVREARAAANLSHPNIVTIYAVGQDQGMHYIAMEYVRGQSLLEHIRDQGQLDVRAALTITRQVAAALAKAHEAGIVHRDLKPQNIMIDEAGRVRVMDFGLAKTMEASVALTAEGVHLGTPLYMAPEQVHRGLVDARTDLYALGVVLYEMLAGRPPFEADTPLGVLYQITHEPFPDPRELNSDVPEDVAALMNRMTAREPADRPGSADDLLRDLDELLGGAPTGSALGTAPLGGRARRSGAKKPASVVQSAVRKSGTLIRRRRKSFALAAALVALAAVLAVVMLSRGPQPGDVRIFAGMEFVWIPPGEFMMGSALTQAELAMVFDENDNYIEHVGEEQASMSAIVSRGFWLGRYEVSQREWQQIMGNNPSQSQGLDLPAENMTGHDCLAFIDKLNAMGEGRFRLPTETEWEYACRAGTTTMYSFGDDPAELGEYGWFRDNCENRTHPVGTKKPNAWQLHDMHGNVWEVCLGESGTEWTHRGGSFCEGAGGCRSAYRGGWHVGSTLFNVGLRLVREADGVDTYQAKEAATGNSPAAVSASGAAPAASRDTASSKWTCVTEHAPWSGRMLDHCLVFADKMWILGGYRGGENMGDVWSSPDGTHWTQVTSAAPWGPRSGHSALVFNDRMWLLGGNRRDQSSGNNDVWVSEDGATWHLATESAAWPRRYSHASVVFQDKMWILGGCTQVMDNLFNDVWCSSDGVTWTQVTPTAAWSGRRNFSAFVAQEMICLFGGLRDHASEEEMWYSDDGATWRRHVAQIPWPPRFNSSVVTTNDAVWFLAGEDPGIGYTNDVWRSPDGLNWTQENPPWSARRNPAAAVFDGYVWIMGGSQGHNGPFFNDVWRYPVGTDERGGTAPATASSSTVWYVQASGSSSRPNGRTWATAYRTIQEAVDAAFWDGGGEVWVAEGTFTSKGDAILTMQEDVHVYGGFAGSETARDQRDWKQHVSAMDGENARLCVRGADRATLDGFLITHGTGGMYNEGFVSPTVRNCVFRENKAASHGSGIANFNGAHPTIVSCEFHANETTVAAGAIANSTMASHVDEVTRAGVEPTIIEDCLFVGNRTKGNGGAIDNFSAPARIEGCVFLNNSSQLGGAVFNNGPFVSFFTNCVFFGNTTTGDGNTAIHNAGSSPALLNCTVVSKGGPAIFNNGSSPVITNCIVWTDAPHGVSSSEDSTPAIGYSLVKGDYPGLENITGNPRFMDALAGDLRLRAGSPCIDTGRPDGAPDTDVAGTRRPQGKGVDIGAYEYAE